MSVQMEVSSNITNHSNADGLDTGDDAPMVQISKKQRSSPDPWAADDVDIPPICTVGTGESVCQRRTTKHVYSDGSEYNG